VGLAAGRVVYDGAPDDFTAEEAAQLYRREEKAEQPAGIGGRVPA